MKRLPWYILVFVWLALAAGCGAGRPAEVRPPDIILGEDTCSDCGMSIMDLRFASAAVTPTGESFLFDDIGDMIRYRTSHALPEGTRYFVHDFDSREWLPADLAYYVRSSTLHSPMGSGLAAFAQKARAEAMVTAEGGTLIEYQKLLTMTEMQTQEMSESHHPTPSPVP